MIDLAGQTIAGYRVEARLGVVGMVEIYRGVHLQLNRPAAIKIIRADLTLNPDFVDHFVREAHEIVNLHHPNIVEVYEFGEQEGRFYFVMEWLKDGTLRTLLQRRQSQAEDLPLPIGVDLVRQAAVGLAYAHSQGIIHGDVKPDLLFLQRSAGPPTHQGQGYQGVGLQAGNALTLKVSDFGLAHLVEAGAATVTDVIIGSLAYMSPERCQGQDPDARSDIYSLGMVLYETVTAYLPFEVKSFDDALYKHCFTQPTPPRQVVAGFPAPIEQVILRCLAKQPADRYQTMDELAAALEAAAEQAGLQVAAPAPPADTAAESILLTTIPLTTRGAAEPPLDRFAPPPAPDGQMALPRVFVIDQIGNQLQSANLTDRGLSVGRASRNDIVLPDDTVSRYHLRVDFDGRQATVTDLGSTNGTVLAGAPLTANAAQPWNPNDWLYVNPFWVWLDLPGQAQQATMLQQAVVPAAPPAGQPQAVQSAAPQDTGPDRIRVELDQSALTITPGRLIVVMATVSNVGRLVDHFTLTVEGVPQSWIQGGSREVHLNPGRQATVPINVVVPQSPANLAGDYPVTVRARSQENPAESGTAQAVWTVLPFTDHRLDLMPRRKSGWRHATYIVTPENQGNVAEQYALTGTDDEQKFSYAFTRDFWPLDPATAARVPMRLEAPWRWIGSKQRQAFNVESKAAHDGTVQSVRGEFEHRALIPIWLIPLILLAIVGIVLLIRLLNQANPPVVISTFNVKPLTVRAGTPVTINWTVKDARSVQLQRKTGQTTSVQGVGLTGSTSDMPFTDTVYGLIAKRTGRRTVRNFQYIRVLPALTPTPKPTSKPAPAPAPVPKPTSKPAAPKPAPTKPPAQKTPAPKPVTVPTHPAPKPTPTRPKPTATVVRRPTATAVPPPLVPIADFVGGWNNISLPYPEPNTLTRLAVTAANPQTISVQAFYSCPQGECQWGTVKMPFKPAGKPPTITAKLKANGGTITISIWRVGNLLHARVVQHLRGCVMCPSQSIYLLRPIQTRQREGLLVHGPHDPAPRTSGD